MLEKLFSDGNYQEAYDGFRLRALDPHTPPREVSADLQQAIACLQQLGCASEIDDLREKTIQAHTGNWRLLQAAAESYLAVDHQGFMVAGRFERGNKRGGGQMMNAMVRRPHARPAIAGSGAPFGESRTRHGRGGGILLRLRPWTTRHERGQPGLATSKPDRSQPVARLRARLVLRPPVERRTVGSDGQPIYYRVPGSYEAAENDGQRWRWALARAAELAPARRNDARAILATFCQSQFGVQTLAQQGQWFGRPADNGEPDGSGTYALDTLAETETIARLATGIRRFSLPDEFNYIKIYQQIVAEPQAGQAENSLTALAEEFENRRQYPRAAEYWRELIEKFGAGADEGRTKRLQQITGNWGQFEGQATQPAGQGATIDFRFRNGRKVHFEAQQIDVERLLADVKAYLRSNQQQLDWQKINVGDIGYRLVEQGEKQYVGKQVAAWDVDLSPRDRHFDKRTTITTPLAKAGAYLVTATMADGNTSRIVLWIADTAIVKKPMANRTYYYVADAVTGEPLPGVNVELFGYHMKPAGRNKTQVETSSTTYHSDATGQVFVDTPAESQRLHLARHRQDRRRAIGLSGLHQCLARELRRPAVQRHQSLYDHRSARLPSRPNGEIQVLDPPSAVRRRRVELCRTDVQAANHESAGR